MTADYARERALLDTILARPEFRGVHGPTWIDHVRQRVLEFLMRTLGGMLAPTQIATVGDLFVDALAVGAVLVTAYVLYRRLRQRTDPVVGPIPPRQETPGATPCISATGAPSRFSKATAPGSPIVRARRASICACSLRRTTPPCRSAT